MKYYIIVNPISGRGHAKEAIPQIEEALRSFNLDFRLVQTEKPWHAADLAEAAAHAGYDVVASASGDGTANEAVNGLMRARAAGFNQTAFCILPVGTGNDMNFGLGTSPDTGGWPPRSGRRAIAAKLTWDLSVAEIILKDAILRTGSESVSMLWLGSKAAKIRWATGLPVYLMAVIRTVFLYFNSPRVEITLDNETLTQPSLMTSIMNGRRMGGGFMMAPEGSPEDGWLDLCIVSEASRVRLFQLIPHFLKGTQATQPEIKMKRSKTVKVRALDGSLPVHSDGETLCYKGQSLEIELIPAALDFVTLEKS